MVFAQPLPGVVAVCDRDPGVNQNFEPPAPRFTNARFVAILLSVSRRTFQFVAPETLLHSHFDLRSPSNLRGLPGLRSKPMRVILALAGNHSREIGNASSGRKMDIGKSCLIETTPTALSAELDRKLLS